MTVDIEYADGFCLSLCFVALCLFGGVDLCYGEPRPRVGEPVNGGSASVLLFDRIWNWFGLSMFELNTIKEYPNSLT